MPLAHNDSLEVIHSPLDQRSYKSIALPNGLRVMLISTYDITSFPEEQDATKPPCQVPEVAEFNKTYLGYDNPAARVRCACPCDERKPCCGRGMSEDENHTNFKDYETLKATCCAKQTRCSEEKEKRVSFERVINDFQRKISSQSDTVDDMERYQKTIFNELQRRAQLKAKQAEMTKPTNEMSVKVKLPPLRPKKSSKNHTHQQIASESSHIDGGQPVILDENKSTIDSHSEAELDPMNYSVLEESLHNRKSSSLLNYPYPPIFSEGMESLYPFRPNVPIRRKFRSQLSPQLSSDLECTAYLVIGSGFFDDPQDQPGLAHFCEHAVFLGSTKFPEPNQLFKLVLPFDGYVNAYTSGMTTTYTTSTSFRLFPLAVEILSDMVGFPLFPNSLVASEIEALDSEYSLRQEDTPRYFQLIGSLAKSGHVMRKMDSGNINTLTVPNFYRKLVEWRRIYYNPNRMTLALEAPFPLDFLEQLALQTFGRIPAAAPLPSVPNRHLMLSSPFEMNRFHQIYHVPSIYHSEFISLHWTLDARAWKNLRVKPLEYLGAIISHKSDGGLFHYLTSQGFATNVEAGCWESDISRNHFTSVFAISVDMTEKGFKRQDNILQAIFGYIQMLINVGPQKQFFQELQKQALDNFHFRAAESVISVAEIVSRWMQFIPPKWCLISPVITAEFDEKIIQKYTESLKIETANVIIFSKNYRGAEYMSSMEEYYNTPYSSYNFPEELEEKVRRTEDEYATKFSLPVPNPLLLNTVCSRSREKDLLEKGTLLKIKGKLSISYESRKVMLVKGLLPQARYSFWIGSPISSYVGATEANSTKLIIWSRFLNDLFETKFYHASNADIQLETEISQGELHLTIAGPHALLPQLTEQVFSLFEDFENIADNTSFEVTKNLFIESLDNAILDNRFLAWDLFYFLWTNHHDLIFDHKRNIDRLTFTTFIAFVKAFKAKMYIQAHLYGYVTKSQGNVVVNALAKLQYDAVESRSRRSMKFRCLRLPLGERILKVNSQNPNTHTSVVINSYQFGQLSNVELEAVNFFAKTMSDAAFYQLRTEQQLGYVIIIYAEVTFGISSIVVELVTQPKNYSTEYCNECIDKFLKDFFAQNFESQEAFQEFSLGKPKLDLPFGAIQNLFLAYLIPNPFTYRKLSVHIVGSIQDGPSTTTSKGVEKNQVFQKFPDVPMDEAGGSNVYKTQSLAARATVKAAKKSLQMRDDSSIANKPKRQSNGSVSSKIVKDFSKFKSSLKSFPSPL